MAPTSASRTHPRAAVVLTTLGSSKEAADIARQLVEEKLAACGTVLPGARSIYGWKGNVDEAEETVLLLKTLPANLDALTRRLRELHPYEVPEVLSGAAVPLTPEYSRWLAEWCNPTPDRKRSAKRR